MMETREKICDLLQKINSEQMLQRVYRFAKFIYIHG